MTESIEKKQIQLIKIAQKQLGIDDDTYREMLYNNFRVTSCTKLSAVQGRALISLLQKKGFVIRRRDGARQNPPRPPFKKGGSGRPRQAGNVVRLASAAEQAKIAALRELIHWRIKDGFTAWLGARFKIERVRTAQEAWRVIEGLKKMFENQMQAAYGARWWEHLPDDDGVRRYVIEHKIK